MRGHRGFVAIVTACLLLESTAGAQVPPPPTAGAAVVPAVPQEGPAAAHDYENGLRLRLAGIVLVSVGSVAGITSAALAPDRSLCGSPPVSRSYVGGDFFSKCDMIRNGLIGGAAGGVGLAAAGVVLWIVGQRKINRAQSAGAVTGLSIGHGPVGSQGLSLRWRF
jgi:hypothetical protein